MPINSTSKSSLLEIRGVSKLFGGVAALREVSFELRGGEIHALLGENGAGKSTLIKILAGVHLPDAGEIIIDGQRAAISCVSDADRYGIRVIHQELSLAPNLSVAENIYLGREPAQGGWLNRRKMFDDAQRLVEQLGLTDIGSVGALVLELSVAQRQLVEIARALSAQAKILVLDEPTSSLSESETEALFETLRRFRSQGVGIIYISHRLDEIIRISDRITVLRDGCSIGTQDTGSVNQQQLVTWIVGREIVDYFHRPAHNPSGVALEVKHLVSDQVHDVSLQVSYGEILGIAGLVGAGRSELVRSIFGIDRLKTGEILVDGKAVAISCPQNALDAGIVLVPEERRKEGLVMIESVAFNLTLPWTKEWNPSFLPNAPLRLKMIKKAVDDFAIKTPDVWQRVDGLSGGNQQKVLVGRWMEHRPKVLILDEPTRGVDVGAREEMFTIISGLVEQGMAVILISSDLAEVMNMSHRIAIYSDGQILETHDAQAVTPQYVMEKLTGARTNDES